MKESLVSWLPLSLKVCFLGEISGEDHLTVSLTAVTSQLYNPNLQPFGSGRLSIYSALKGISSLLDTLNSLSSEDHLTVSLTAMTSQLHTPNLQPV